MKRVVEKLHQTVQALAADHKERIMKGYYKEKNMGHFTAKGIGIFRVKHLTSGRNLVLSPALVKNWTQGNQWKVRLFPQQETRGHYPVRILSASGLQLLLRDLNYGQGNWKRKYCLATG